MMHTSRNRSALPNQRHYGVTFVSVIVAAHGLLILATTLVEQIIFRHSPRITDLTVDVSLLVGLSLLFLSVYLRRKKRTAWLVTMLAYTFYLGTNIDNLLDDHANHDLRVALVLRVVVLPLAILGLLLAYRSQFIVQSDTQGFRVAARISLLVLLVAFVYGVSGFLLLDKSDFHQEITTPYAIQRTVDQFDLTTNHPLHPYTRRAHLFLDSLSFVSIGAIVYAGFSLFQPLRARFSDQSSNREHMIALLSRGHSSSEDFFKIWPHDKQYFFDESGSAGLALHVHRGVALCLGDPSGTASHFSSLLQQFHEICFSNDWTPAMIHTDHKQRKLYEANGYSMQKIGQEAVVNIAHFEAEVSRNKYFRHITNKFTKQDFSCEMLTPPHHDAVLQRLKVISDDWLTQPGRVERGYAMGYFTNEYMQQCSIMVVRDAAGTIQAFLNQVPAAFDSHEATYDLLRHTSSSLSNINDFLLNSFIMTMQERGYTDVNLGLCPLAGLHERDPSQQSFIDNILRFAYANGDRIYSFSGLYRFKSKYEPDWHDRFIVYQGGVRGFSRTMTALARAMRVRRLR